MTLYSFSKKIASFFLHIFFRIKVHDRLEEPKGALVLASNHISAFDPIILAIVMKRPIKFIAKKELYKNKLVAWFLNKIGTFPVDRKANDITAIKNCLRVLKNGEVLGIFPEGTRVKNISRENMKNGVGLIALKGAENILTVRIQSNYKLFSRVDIYFKEIIPVEQYKALNEHQEDVITSDIFNSIYEDENGNSK